METEILIAGLGSIIAIQLWTLKRLNFTCMTITKIVTFLKIRYPNDTRDVL